MPTEEQGLIDATLWPEPGAGVLHEHFEAVTRRRRAAMMAWMSRAIIPVPLLCLSLLAGSSTLRVWAQPVDPHLEDVLHAVFAHIEPDSSVAILSGPGLGPKAAAALRTLIPRALQLPPGMPSSSLPPDAVRVDRVVVTDSRAVVHLTYGPVPAELTWLCGQAITIPLRRTDLWQVLESEARVRCAREGPRGLSREGERLLEAVRLAFSHIGLHPDVRVVADPKLSSSALSGLRAITDVPSSTHFESETMILPSDVFAVRRLALEADGVGFAGTLGPVPRHASLACGTNWRMRVQQHADGWTFEDIKITVC